MTITAEQIRQRMQSVRNEIDDDVGELVEQAKSLVDWRDYVRSYPLPIMGLACLLGVMVVPKRQKVNEIDAASVVKMLKNEKLVVAPGATVKQSSFAGPLFMAVASALARTAIANFAQSGVNQYANRVAAKNAGDTSPSHPSSPR